VWTQVIRATPTCVASDGLARATVLSYSFHIIPPRPPLSRPLHDQRAAAPSRESHSIGDHLLRRTLESSTGEIWTPIVGMLFAVDHTTAASTATSPAESAGWRHRKRGQTAHELGDDRLAQVAQIRAPLQRSTATGRSSSLSYLEGGQDWRQCVGPAPLVFPLACCLAAAALVRRTTRPVVNKRAPLARTHHQSAFDCCRPIFDRKQSARLDPMTIMIMMAHQLAGGRLSPLRANNGRMGVVIRIECAAIDRGGGGRLTARSGGRPVSEAVPCTPSRPFSWRRARSTSATLRAPQLIDRWRDSDPLSPEAGSHPQGSELAAAGRLAQLSEFPIHPIESSRGLEAWAR
jgi:hypothetical protein